MYRSILASLSLFVMHRACVPAPFFMCNWSTMAFARLILHILLLLSTLAFVSGLSREGLTGLFSDDPVDQKRLTLSQPSSRSYQELGECTAVPLLRVKQANLTKKDLEVLPHICWRERDSLTHQPLLQITRSGIPAGVQCTASQW